MRRFTSNRSWTLIPALCLSLLLSITAATDLHAERREYEDGVAGSGGGGAAPPTASGDPDSPGAAIKGGGGPGWSSGSRWSASTTRTVGDSRTVASAWKW